MRESQRFTPILVLFLAFRLMHLATFLPGDLTRFGDYPYYYSLARRLWQRSDVLQSGEGEEDRA